MRLFSPPLRSCCEYGGAVCLARSIVFPAVLLILLVFCHSEIRAQIVGTHTDQPIGEALRLGDVGPASPPVVSDSLILGRVDQLNRDRERAPNVIDSSSYEWMHVGQLTSPTRHVSEANRVESTLVRQDVLEILDMQLKFNERPPYVQERYYEFIDARPRQRSRREKAFQRLAHKQFYRHLRRLLRKQWREDFLESAWSYDDYVDGLTNINKLGGQGGNSNEINAEYLYNTVRNDALSNDGLEGERESVVLRYGPFGLTDDGQFDIDLRSILSSGSQDMNLEIDPVDHADDAMRRRIGSAADPVFTGRCYKIRPKLKIRVDPFRALDDSPERVLRSYAASLDVTFYSDITKRKLFSIEAEAKVRREEWGCFVNFVIDGWR
jgi:hypothetical protein